MFLRTILYKLHVALGTIQRYFGKYSHGIENKTDIAIVFVRKN